MNPRPTILPISNAVLNDLSELRRSLPSDLDTTQVHDLYRFVEETYAHGYCDGATRALVQRDQQAEADRRNAEIDADAAAHPEPPAPCEHPHLLQIAGAEGPRAFHEGDYVRLAWHAGTVHDTLTFSGGDWWVDNNLVLVLGRRLDPAERGHESFPEQDSTSEWITWWHNGDHPADGVNVNEDGAVVTRFQNPRVPGGTYHSCGKVFNEHGLIVQGTSSAMVCPGQQVSAVPTVRDGFYLVRDMPDA